MALMALMAFMASVTLLALMALITLMDVKAVLPHLAPSWNLSLTEILYYSHPLPATHPATHSSNS